MAEIVREVRAIPVWLVREYLEELGGRIVDPLRVDGDGWQARIVELDDHVVGSLRVGRASVRVEGDDRTLDALVEHLDRKLLRAGG